MGGLGSGRTLGLRNSEAFDYGPMNREALARMEKLSWMRAAPMKLTIQMATPSQNELMGKHRNFHAKKAHRTEWEKAVYDAALASRQHKALLEQAAAGARLKLTFNVYRAKELDHLNALGGLKHVVDALRNVGYLKDDSPQYLAKPELFTHVVGNKGQKRTDIEIEVEQCA